MNTARLTAADEKLLALLKLDARESTAALARKLGVSRTTVQDRIRRLEEAGVIVGYTVRIDSTYAERQVVAHALLKVDPKQGAKVVKALERIEGMSAVYALSGAFDYLGVIRAATTQDIDRVLDELGRVDGVLQTQTSIVLSVKFER